MTNIPKKDYVSISARIPKEVYLNMSKIRDSLDMTTNQIVSHCIEDWVQLVTDSKLTTTHRIAVAKYSLKITDPDKSEWWIDLDEFGNSLSYVINAAIFDLETISTFNKLSQNSAKWTAARKID